MTLYAKNTILYILLFYSLTLVGLSPSYALTFTETQKLRSSNGDEVGDFGRNVSISGDTAVIGAAGFDGIGFANVFVRDSRGVWLEQQKLTASDGARDDLFSHSAVSISGDRIVIGAIGDDDNGDFSGSAYVFERNSMGIWNEQQKLTASDGAAGDEFSTSVSISGDTALIGVYRDDDNGDSSGSAYVFVRDSAGLWTEQQKLTASDGAADDFFGTSVSVFGDIALIGAVGDDEDGDYSGSAYVFVRDGTGMWNEEQKLSASDAKTFDFFGQSISISGDSAVIGAHGDGDNGTEFGSAYVFVRDGIGMWNEQQKLSASDAEIGDQFGWDVSISGDTIVVSSDHNNNDSSGSAYVFIRNLAGVWREQQKLSPIDREDVIDFSWSVSISGDTFVVGAKRTLNDNSFQTGAAYMFDGSDLTVEKRINNRVRLSPAKAAKLLSGTRFRAEYKVTNSGPDRLFRVQVFEGAQIVCNLYVLQPGETNNRCVRNQDVLLGDINSPATVTAKVSGSNETLTHISNAFYTGQSKSQGGLFVKHYVNNENADSPADAETVNGNTAEILFQVANYSNIELYRIKTYHDPARPINSGWQQQCVIGTLLPNQVRYCKRTISTTQAGLNKAYGRAQGTNAKVNPTDYINASNPSYFNVVLP